MENIKDINALWRKISIIADPMLADALSDFLIGLVGAEVDIAVDDGQSVITMNAYIRKMAGDDEQSDAILQQIRGYAIEIASLFDVPVPEITTTVIVDQDWANAWKEHFKPFAILPGLVIKPTWEAYQAKADERVIEMDPGMAFGTGHHATTRLALTFLKHVLEQRNDADVLDVGTGTGILGMAAVLFGARRVVAIDNDPDAVAAAEDNVRRNALAQSMAVSTAPLVELPGPFAIVVANIIYDTLVDLADELVRMTAIGGHLILSGILTGEQSDGLGAVYAGKGLLLQKHTQEKEWSALLFVKMEG